MEQTPNGINFHISCRIDPRTVPEGISREILEISVNGSAKNFHQMYNEWLEPRISSGPASDIRIQDFLNFAYENHEKYFFTWVPGESRQWESLTYEERQIAPFRLVLGCAHNMVIAFDIEPRISMAAIFNVLLEDEALAVDEDAGTDEEFDGEHVDE